MRPSRKRHLISKLFWFLLHVQLKLAASRSRKLLLRSDQILTAPVWEEVELWGATLLVLNKLLASCDSRLQLCHLQICEEAPVEQINSSLAKTKELLDEVAPLVKNNEACMERYTIFSQCEIEPHRREMAAHSQLMDDLLHRAQYLRLWSTGQTTAPALEVLLYMFVPAVHLQSLTGDLQEEYTIRQIAATGPKAAQWWYTKQVVSTLWCYLYRTIKRLSAIAGTMEALTRIWHYVLRLFS